MSTRISTIAIIHNAPVGDSYRYHDRHVDDTQGSSSFLQIRGGWTASYRQASDEWHVRTPSGLNRTYTRVR